MNDLVTRLLAVAEKAVDEALQLDYGDPEDRYIYRELQELRQLVQQGKEGLPPDYIDAEHSGSDREMLEVFYRTCRSEGGTADEIHLRALKAVLVQQGRPAIEPVPVSERLPEPEDCDSQGRCWWFNSLRVEYWFYIEPGNRSLCETHWLPYHALPLPTK